MEEKYYIHLKCKICGCDMKTTKYRMRDICRKCSIQETWKQKTKEQLQELSAKKKQTCIDRYGVDNPAKVEAIKEKIKQTCIDKYGVESALQREDIHQKGIEASSQPDIRKKAVEHTDYKKVVAHSFSTYEEKTGFSHPMRNPSVKKNIINKYGQIGHVAKYKINDILFDSYWEIAFYFYKKQTSKEVVVHPEVSFEYISNDGSIHLYQPDFLIDGTFYEIKGTQFFNEKHEPFNMYTGKYWWEKYNCMLEHGVKILEKNDLKEILKNFKKDDFKQFKI